MSDLHPCEYCGTMLDENDEVESNIAACGPRMQHFTSQCREYVHAAKESYKRDVVVLRGQVADLRSMLGGLALMIKHKSCCDGEDARTTPEAKSAVELALATVKRTGDIT